MFAHPYISSRRIPTRIEPNLLSLPTNFKRYKSNDKPYDHLSFKQLCWHTAVHGMITYGGTTLAERAVDIGKKYPQAKWVKWGIEPVLRRACQVFVSITLEDAIQDARQRLDRGQDIILDYAAAEEGATDSQHNSVLNTTRHLIDEAQKLKKAFPERSIDVAVKLSTLCHTDFLERVSAHFSTESSQSLSEKDKSDWIALSSKLRDLFFYAKEKGVRCVLDAEWEGINDAIVAIWLDAIKEDLPVVGTIQAYLKRSCKLLFYLRMQMIALNEKCYNDGFPKVHQASIKVVCGAYINKPEERAYIWPTEAKTHRNYIHLLKQAMQSSCFKQIIVATHNPHIHLTAAILKNTHHKENIQGATLAGMGEELNKLPMAKYTVFLMKDEYDDFWNKLAYFVRRGHENADNNGREFKSAKKALKERMIQYVKGTDT